MTLFQDYIQLSRLSRPIGIWLLLFPGFIGLSMAPQKIPLSYWAIFIVGAVVMRSAGCIYNDIIDRPFDGGIERTKNRPLVRAKQPMSLKLALLFLGGNLIVGLICLLQFNSTTILVGFSAAIMIILYPWMKRITYWPQLFLGFTMNMGVVVGFFAVEGARVVEMLLIYAGMVGWTLGYDTVYGFQDMEGDAMMGVKSSALRTRSFPKSFLLLVYGCAIFLWLVSGGLMNFSLIYYVGIVISGMLLVWQAITLDINNPKNCLARFQSNQWVGIILWVSCMLASIKI